MKKKLPSIQSVNFFAFLTCCILLGIGAYLQLDSGLEPCPLCIVQRFIIALLAILFLVGAILQLRDPAHAWYHFVIFFVTGLGIAAAGRQVYLTFLPPNEVPPCGPGLSYMLENLPLSETLKVLVRGSGECAKVTWEFLTFSIPEWTFIFFCLLSLIALIQMLRKI